MSATVSPLTDPVRDLLAVLGRRKVLTDERAILRVIRDNSWLSPVLSRELARRQQAEGKTLGVQAVARPETVADALCATEVAVRHQVAITPRGSGTSNFGLVTPSRGGVIVDLRKLRGPCRAGDGGIGGPAGMLQGELDRQARQAGQELPVLTTTYATATAAGWVAGGHVGLGSGVHGAIWDGLVLGAKVITATSPPQILDLRGAEIEPVLHTFGTMGVIVEVTLKTVPARDWLEAAAFFASFEACSEFVRQLSDDMSLAHRAAAAQEEALTPCFRPLSELGAVGSVALLIIDGAQEQRVRQLARANGGSYYPWQRFGAGGRPPVAVMVYGHRMLWVKKQFPRAAFLHLYFDPHDPLGHARLLKQRYGAGVLLEMKFIRSPWLRRALGYGPDGILPACVVTLVEGAAPGAVSDVLRFCEGAGIRYQNPHTAVIEDNGLFGHTLPALAAFKSRVDPANLFNPGKFRAADRLAAR